MNLYNMTSIISLIDFNIPLIIVICIYNSLKYPIKNCMYTYIHIYIYYPLQFID